MHISRDGYGLVLFWEEDKFISSVLHVLNASTSQQGTRPPLKSNVWNLLSPEHFVKHEKYYYDKRIYKEKEPNSHEQDKLNTTLLHSIIVVQYHL